MIALPTLEAKEIKLESDIASALREGMAKTFGDNPSPFALEVATEFALNAAPGITKAITDFVKSLTVNVPSAPQGSLVAPPTGGPVTGVVMIQDPFIQIG